MSMKKVTVFLFLIFISINGNTQEAVVSEFGNLFSLKFSANFNVLIYQEKINSDFISNRPMDIGIGFCYKDFSVGFTVNIPFIYDEDKKKSESFDVNINYFFRDVAIFNGFIKDYKGFHDAFNNRESDMEIFSVGFSGNYIFNRDHSLRSVYNLDRKQLSSNGSFLIGGGIFYSSVNFNDTVSIIYKELHFGPNAGYSYTWVLKRDFFINIVGIVGINGIKNDENFSFGMQCLPKISIGYHGKTWSMNIFSNASVLLSNIRRHNEYLLNSGTGGIGFSKRI
jgi:hypothetical protein